MRKSLFVAVPALFISYNSMAQGSQNLQLPTVYVQNTVTGSNSMPTNVIGSPYLNEEFVIGTVTIKGEESYQTYLRYNAFNDELEMRNGNTTNAVMKRDYITVRLGRDVYSIHTYAMDNDGVKDGYFSALNEGKAVLLRRRQMNLREGQAATSSYGKDKPPRFELVESYYISIDKETAQPVKLNKKGVLGAFGDKSSALNGFVKKNKLKLKSEAEVLQLLEHYNSL
ncbi:MAG: hypothetical protein KJO94_09180 [Eudoraea sp.]|nr:hypothetical protein [Eudoraea sp.]MBT8323639.1 hypothetical protein [Eudoraea sp.]